MLPYIMFVISVVGVFAALIGALVWTLKLETVTTRPDDITASSLRFDSFRVFPWPKADN